MTNITNIDNTQYVETIKPSVNTTTISFSPLDLDHFYYDLFVNMKVLLNGGGAALLALAFDGDSNDADYQRQIMNDTNTTLAGSLVDGAATSRNMWSGSTTLDNLTTSNMRISRNYGIIKIVGTTETTPSDFSVATTLISMRKINMKVTTTNNPCSFTITSSVAGKIAANSTFSMRRSPI